MADDVFLAAHHEAGHAVAATRRGYAVTEIVIDPERGFTEYAAIPHGDDHAFIVYAGPWAHARALWMSPTADSDARDEDGVRFSDRVAAQMQNNIADWKTYEGIMPDGDPAAVDAAASVRTQALHGELFDAVVQKDIAQPNAEWNAELASAWTDIQDLSRHLIAGDDVIQVGTSTLHSIGTKYWAILDA